MIYAMCRIHYGLQVVFCIRHATPSHYHHYADLLTCIWHLQWYVPNACLNACWVYSVESVYKVYLVLSVTCLIFYTKCVACMCWTGPFNSRWSRGYDYNSSYNHRQIGRINISNSSHIFLWWCAWGGCTIYILFHIYPGKAAFCALYHRAVLCCAQIMDNIIARCSYLFVCT